MQLSHLRVPAGLAVWVSFFCTHLGSNEATATGEKKKCVHAAIRLAMSNSASKLEEKKKQTFFLNSILNVTATEPLHNRAITKMASKKWMLGHSEDYVSVFVPCFGAHCNSLSSLISSQPNCEKIQTSLQENTFSKTFTEATKTKNE